MAAAAAASDSAWLLPPQILENSPSRADAVREEDEKTYRRRTAIFMERAGEFLKFPRLTIATAQVFFHRFYALQSFKKYKRFEIAVTCLFLSGKVEEHPRKLEHVICMCHQLWNKHSAPTLKSDTAEYEAMRQTILKCERVLLHTIAFDLCVKHPYKNLIDTVKLLHQSKLIDDKSKKEFAQNALNFLNDSMRTSLCLQYDPQKIASAAIYLATVYLDQIDMSRNSSTTEKWKKHLKILPAELSSICSQIMEVYDQTLNVDTASDPQGARMRLMHSKLVSSGVVAPQDPRVRRGGGSSSAAALSGGESDREGSKRTAETDDEEQPAKRNRPDP